MKTVFFKYSIFSLLVFSSCSTINDGAIYRGNYKGKNITINFTNAKKGYFLVDDMDSIPFNYKIERSKVERKSIKETVRKVKYFVYRFSISAEYNIDFPLGLLEIGQKRGKIIQATDSLIFIRQDKK